MSYSFSSNNVWFQRVPDPTSSTDVQTYAWAPVDVYDAITAHAGGFTNPMTGVGDFIRGGTAGAPTRLAPPGADGAYSVTFTSNVPSWTAAASGAAADAWDEIKWNTGGIVPSGATTMTGYGFLPGNITENDTSSTLETTVYGRALRQVTASGNIVGAQASFYTTSNDFGAGDAPLIMHGRVLFPTGVADFTNQAFYLVRGYAANFTPPNSGNLSVGFAAGNYGANTNWHIWDSTGAGATIELLDSGGSPVAPALDTLYDVIMDLRDPTTLKAYVYAGTTLVCSGTRVISSTSGGLGFGMGSVKSANPPTNDVGSDHYGLWVALTGGVPGALP